MTSEELQKYLYDKNIRSVENAIVHLFPYDSGVKYTSFNRIKITEMFGLNMFGNSVADWVIEEPNAVWDFIRTFRFKNEDDMITARMMLG